MIPNDDALITVPVRVLYKLYYVDRGEHGECLLCEQAGWTDDQHRIFHLPNCEVGKLVGTRES